MCNNDDDDTDYDDNNNDDDDNDNDDNDNDDGDKNKKNYDHKDDHKDNNKDNCKVEHEDKQNVVQSNSKKKKTLYLKLYCASPWFLSFQNTL